MIIDNFSGAQLDINNFGANASIAGNDSFSYNDKALLYISTLVPFGAVFSAKEKFVLNQLFVDLENGLGTGINLLDPTKLGDIWPIVGGSSQSVVRGILGNVASLAGTFTISNTEVMFTENGSFRTPFSQDDLGGVYSGQLMAGSLLNIMGGVVYSPISRKVVEIVTGNNFRHFIDSNTSFDYGNRFSTTVIMHGRNNDANVYLAQRDLRGNTGFTIQAIARAQNSNAVKLWYGTINGNTVYLPTNLGLVANFRNINNDEASLYFNIVNKFLVSYQKLRA